MPRSRAHIAEFFGGLEMCAADLDGARIVVSLHQAAGVLLAQPIIYPGHVCALSVGAPDYELKLGPAGEISRHDYFYLGISYDRRIINGKEAAAFLTSDQEAARVAAAAPRCAARCSRPRVGYPAPHGNKPGEAVA